MKLEIRKLHSADIDDLQKWEPNQRNEVYFQLEFEVGLVGEKSGHYFELVVATPHGLSWFSRSFDTEFPDRAILLFKEYSWSAMVSRLQRILETCTRESWQESIDQLRLYFAWEYEDLRKT